MIDKIRFKLTMYNTMIVIAIVVFLSIFIYAFVTINSTIDSDDRLSQMTYELKRYDSLIEKGHSASEASDEYEAFKQRASSRYISYGIYDFDGNLKVFVNNINEAMPEGLSNIRLASFYSIEAEKTIDLNDGRYEIYSYNYLDHDLRICTSVFANESGQMRIAICYSSMKSLNEMAYSIRSVLIITLFVALILSVIAGYFLSGRAIIPISESVERQNQLFADASHELRTPLTIIRTNLDVVKMSADETVGSQSQWIDNAYFETERMQRLVTDLLSVAKADLDQDQLKKEPCDIKQVVFATCDKFMAHVQSKGIELKRKNLTPKADYTLVADQTKIDQLITILIDNAINYIGKGSHINVNIRKKDDHIVIEVSDDGIGMKKEDTQKVFERFYRVDKARSRSQGGTGLGLSIAKRIVELHDGQISCQSRLNEGTTMTVDLPAGEM